MFGGMFGGRASIDQQPSVSEETGGGEGGAPAVEEEPGYYITPTPNYVIKSKRQSSGEKVCLWLVF